MKISIVVEKGPGKDECEDAVLAGTEVVNEGEAVFDREPFCICAADGVGGNRGGKDAAQFLVRSLGGTETFDLSADTVKTYLQDMNRALLESARALGDKSNMAAALTGLFITPSECVLYHSGNTRLYVLQGRYLKQMTKDQTTYQWLLHRDGYEAAQACNKNEITGCFGGGDIKFLDRLSVSEVFENGLPEVFLFTSDGVHDYVDIDTLEEIIADSHEDLATAREIIKIANNHGSVDDKTIIIVRNRCCVNTKSM